MAAGLVHGIQALHGQGLVHLDVKSDNVLRAEKTEGLSTQIIDFDFAVHFKVVGGGAVQKEFGNIGPGFGTKSYLHPEMWSGSDALNESDVAKWFTMYKNADAWSVMCTVYELLAALANAAGGVPPRDWKYPQLFPFKYSSRMEDYDHQFNNVKIPFLVKAAEALKSKGDVAHADLLTAGIGALEECFESLSDINNAEGADRAWAALKDLPNFKRSMTRSGTGRLPGLRRRMANSVSSARSSFFRVLNSAVYKLKL